MVEELKQKRKLYLHIGTGKTGTSAIQSFLTINRNALRKKGIMYPVQHMLPAQHRLAQCLLAETRQMWWFPEDLKSYRQEWAEVLRQCNENVSLISSEIFFQLEKEQIQKIKELLDDYSVKIIVYLRRQEGLLLSGYNQSVKATGFKRSPEGIIMKEKRFDYYRILGMWAEAFGTENIIVRPFEKDQFYGGTIFADFLYYAFGMELTKKLKLPKGRFNTRIHRVALEYKRLVNNLPVNAQEINGMRDVFSAVSDCCYLEGMPDPPVLSPCFQMEIIHKYASRNASVAREYLGRDDGRIFNTPLPDLGQKWNGYNTLLKEDALKINAFLTKNFPEAMEVVMKGVALARSCQETGVKEAAALLQPGMPFDRAGQIVNKQSPSRFSLAVKLRMSRVKSAVQSKLKGLFERMPLFIRENHWILSLKEHYKNKKIERRHMNKKRW